MFLFHHALVVDMLVDAPDTPSIAPSIGVRGSMFATFITETMMIPWTSAILAANDGCTSILSWLLLNGGRYKGFVDQALWRVCAKGHENLLVDFLDGFNWVSIDYNYGFSGACRGGQRRIVELMVRKGATHWNVGLALACQGGHGER